MIICGSCTVEATADCSPNSRRTLPLGRLRSLLMLRDCATSTAATPNIAARHVDKYINRLVMLWDASVLGNFGTRKLQTPLHYNLQPLKTHSLEASIIFCMFDNPDLISVSHYHSSACLISLRPMRIHMSPTGGVPRPPLHEVILAPRASANPDRVNFVKFVDVQSRYSLRFEALKVRSRWSRRSPFGHEPRVLEVFGRVCGSVAGVHGS